MFNEELYDEEIRLEKEARGLTVERYRRQLTQSRLEGSISEGDVGQFLLRVYIRPLTDAIADFIKETTAKKVGRKVRAGPLLAEAAPEVSAFILLKVLINRLAMQSVGPAKFTQVAMKVARKLEQELLLQAFDAQHRSLSKVIEKDFNKRDLPPVKREEYLRGVLRRTPVERKSWTKSEQVSVGVALLDLFVRITGDVKVVTVRKKKKTIRCLVPQPSFLRTIEKRAGAMEALFTLYNPTVIPPRDWSLETLELGGYWSHHVMSYPLVKASTSPYRRLLHTQVKEGGLPEVLAALNAIQRTPWAVNKPVLKATRYVYENNIPCGKLPPSDSIEPEPSPIDLTVLPKDHPEAKKYRRYRAMVHEENRRVIAKRLGAFRALEVAEQFSKYERIYFPHDLDSRGRAYPKPGGFNPQGPDYVKGLLMFAEGKPLGPTGIKWLGIHGANSYGADKLLSSEKASWAHEHLDLARAIREDPCECLEWTKADQPVQFLAWCIEWAEAHDLRNPEDYLSHLHVDLDATCSGLQHFSAMLRDEVGGYHVNMTRCSERQDVYGAVALKTSEQFTVDLSGDKQGLAEAWMSFGIDRSITKRPVMVKPYSGTFQSCLQYVEEAVQAKILKKGVDPPFAELWPFATYGAKAVWASIPKVVVAAEEALKWLTDVTRVVAKSKPQGQRVTWRTPLGFEVWMSKKKTKHRRIATRLEGTLVHFSVSEELEDVDVRRMLSSVPPSFVHSLDAAHLQLTIATAAAQGISGFAVVHDSFGVHACDAERFAGTIRAAFVSLYEREDVLESFLSSARSQVPEDLHSSLPPVPQRGSLDLQEVLDNEFFFS